MRLSDDPSVRSISTGEREKRKQETSKPIRKTDWDESVGAFHVALTEPGGPILCFGAPPLFLTLDHVMSWGTSRDREKARNKAQLTRHSRSVRRTMYNVRP